MGGICEHLTQQRCLCLGACVSWLCPCDFVPRSPSQHIDWEGAWEDKGHTEKCSCARKSAQPPPPQPLIWVRGPSQGSVASADLMNLSLDRLGPGIPRLCLLRTGPTPSWWASWSVREALAGRGQTEAVVGWGVGAVPDVDTAGWG